MENPTPDSLLKCLDDLCDASAALPDIRLLPGERMTRAAYCTDDADAIVRAVSRALSARPDLFPDVAARPDELVARLDRSLAFLALSRFLERLHRSALDGYLLDRSTAARDALKVVEQVRRSGRLPYASPGQKEREAALRAAEHLLSERVRQRQRKARSTAQRRTGTGAQRAAPPAHRPPCPRR